MLIAPHQDLSDGVYPEMARRTILCYVLTNSWTDPLLYISLATLIPLHRGFTMSFVNADSFQHRFMLCLHSAWRDKPDLRSRESILEL
jgi:hypothetical protein